MFYTIIVSIIFSAILLLLAVKAHKSYIEIQAYHTVKIQTMELERQNLSHSKETLERLIEQIEAINLSRQGGLCNEEEKRKCEICTLACIKETQNNIRKGDGV